MKKSLLTYLCLFPILAQAQPILTKWQFNVGGKKASYWQPAANGGAPYTFTNLTDLADVLQVCYSTDYVWVSSNGLTDNMGQYHNPGACSKQTYVHRFPRKPTVPTTKTISNKIGQIGLLLNGIPIYGLGNASSWNGSTNLPPQQGGSGIWNVEVYKSEGVALDTAFGAHPQQMGAYHTHATPLRLYKNTPTTQHSPLIGFAFDGYPVYGPYGYSTATNASSAITRMKTGYALRNITTRTMLPYNVTATQTGPPVNTTYPIGTYCEDYEWSAANGGDLDKYNGRLCVTPEYPAGTYAYFVTISAAGVPQFPYIIGVEYYGAPETTNFTAAGATTNTVSLPTSGLTCVTSSITPIELVDFSGNTEGGYNKLKWTTASEINLSHYNIERSSDGKKFETIGTLASKGNSNRLQTHFFTDASPLGVSYYRLWSVDLDGKDDVSKTIVLSQKTSRVSVFPTQTNDAVRVILPPSVFQADVSVFDLLGRQVLSQKLNNTEGSISLANFPNGVYLVSVRANNTVFSTKILKQ